MPGPLEGKVALVAGATRGAGRGFAVELGAAGATVYVTGRSTRAQRSEYDRPETIAVERAVALGRSARGRARVQRRGRLAPGLLALSGGGAGGRAAGGC